MRQWRGPVPNVFSDVGIGDDLVARGVLGAREVKAALKRYADRLMYQKCLGGAPVDLEGMSVSNKHRRRAQRLVARFTRAICRSPRSRPKPKAKTVRGRRCGQPVVAAR
jgi:hypothetical protein